MTFRKCLARDAAPRAKPHRLPPAKAPWAPAIRCDGRFWQYRMGGEGVEKVEGTIWWMQLGFVQKDVQATCYSVY